MTRILLEKFMIPLVILQHFSDYYLKNIQENKISGNEPFDIRLHPVPKILGDFKKKFPELKLVTFKLETEGVETLERKMRKAVEAYKVDLVVGNILETRYEEILFLQNNEIQLIRGENQNLKIVTAVESLLNT